MIDQIVSLRASKLVLPALSGALKPAKIWPRAATETTLASFRLCNSKSQLRIVDAVPITVRVCAGDHKIQFMLAHSACLYANEPQLYVNFLLQQFYESFPEIDAGFKSA